MMPRYKLEHSHILDRWFIVDVSTYPDRYIRDASPLAVACHGAYRYWQDARVDCDALNTNTTAVKE